MGQALQGALLTLGPLLSRRGAGVVERGGLENRCALCVPGVRIPPPPPAVDCATFLAVARDCHLFTASHCHNGISRTSGADTASQTSARGRGPLAHKPGRRRGGRGFNPSWAYHSFQALSAHSGGVFGLGEPRCPTFIRLIFVASVGQIGNCRIALARAPGRGPASVPQGPLRRRDRWTWRRARSAAALEVLGQLPKQPLTRHPHLIDLAVDVLDPGMHVVPFMGAQ